MTREQARELFSDAAEGALTSEQRAGFESLLARDHELASEYREFQHMLELVGARARSLGRSPTPNLMPGIQRRLQKQRGRYLRDRFAQQVKSGAVNPWLVGAVMLCVALLAWVALWWMGQAPP